jgi:hypothetical protein
MKKLVSKSKRSVLRGAVMTFAGILVVFLLLTGCGAGKASLSATPAVEYQLDDSCALIHIYRPGAFEGSLVRYTIHMDDEALFRVTNKSKTTVRVTSEGLKTFWAKTETREELPLEIELGNEYYIRCGVRMGAFVGRPRLDIVNNQVGKVEFNRIK